VDKSVSKVPVIMLDPARILASLGLPKIGAGMLTD
jgi:hypothetical protein